MSISVIEGEIVESHEGRSPPFGNGTIWKKVVWHTSDGGEEELKRFVVDRSMNPCLEAGRSGRFYICKAIDQRGIFGFRGRDGTDNFAWPGGARYLGTIMTIMGSLLLLMRFVLDSGLPLLGVIVAIFGIALLVVDNGNRKEGEDLYDSDAPG